MRTDDVVAYIPELRRRFSITRIGDTTRLDRAAVPTMCAVVPDSPDDVSMYGGKGCTREAALIGAVMETVERQTAAACALPEQLLSADSVQCGLDLQACGIRSEYLREPMAFVEASDLITGDPLFVPKALVQMPWRGPPAFACTHTNGLAAAFTYTDAVYHALMEIIERHLWGVTHARAHLRPARIVREALGDNRSFVDDPVPRIALPAGEPRVDWLFERITDAGLELRLVAMLESGFPIGMLATVRENSGTTTRAHAGCGCSWSPVEAAVGAITEAIQGRVADTHASRENIFRADDPPTRFSDHNRRKASLPHGRWYFDGPTQSVRLAELTDNCGPDANTELQRAIACVARIAKRIALVDMSPEDGAFVVVRVIAPELDSMLVDGRIGSIARAIVEER